MQEAEKKIKIPSFVKYALWSYDVSKLDLKKHKDLIIKNVLDYGTKQATDWLKKIYSKEEIRNVIRQTPKSAWSKKSINLWSIVYGVEPQYNTRIEKIMNAKNSQ